MKLINQTKIFKFIVPIIVFILLYAVSTIRNNNVRKDGIYSIVTLIKYGSAYRGQRAKYEFIYNKTLYKGSFFISFNESKNTPIGIDKDMGNKKIKRTLFSLKLDTHKK